MAFMSQERKKELAPAIKAVLAKYKMKGSISVRHHSSLVVTVRSGEIDFGKDFATVNPYWIEEHFEDEIQRNFLMELKEAMMTGNHDNSDIMTDYFDVGWYIDINIGGNKPYVYTGAKT
jgi:hypothetical protein